VRTRPAACSCCVTCCRSCQGDQAHVGHCMKGEPRARVRAALCHRRLQAMVAARQQQSHWFSHDHAHGAARQAGEFELALLLASGEAHDLAPGCLAQLHFSLASHCALTLTDVVVPAMLEPASPAALAFV